MKELIAHPKGEPKEGALVPVRGPVAVDTFAGRVHVEWDPQAAVTPLGQLVFFAQYLKVSGLFDPWIEECPLQLSSPNAPRKRDVLGTAALSILSGHQRYAHINGLRGNGINPGLLDMSQVVSEDSVRRNRPSSTKRRATSGCKGTCTTGMPRCSANRGSWIRTSPSRCCMATRRVR